MLRRFRPLTSVPREARSASRRLDPAARRRSFLALPEYGVGLQPIHQDSRPRRRPRAGAAAAAPAKTIGSPAATAPERCATCTAVTANLSHSRGRNFIQRALGERGMGLEHELVHLLAGLGRRAGKADEADDCSRSAAGVGERRGFALDAERIGFQSSRERQSTLRKREQGTRSRHLPAQHDCR